MAVSRRKDRGTWQARLVGPNGRAISKQFERKADAVRWHSEQLSARERGDWIDPRDGKVTLAQFYADWSQRQVWETNTVWAMDLSVRSATFADIPLARIRRSHVETWVKAMVSAGRAPGTIHTRVVNVRSVLRAAVRDRLISSDPSEGVQLPRQRKREAAMVLPTVDQVRALLEHADKWFAVFLGLCAFAGLRLGEAAALQIGDVDFLRRQLSVTRQVQRGKGGTIEIRAPKYGSERSIALPDQLLTMLARHVETLPSQWLFTDTRGEPPYATSIGNVWRATCKRAGVTGLTLHSLRHFAASTWIASGCSVVTVQTNLGHAKASTTLDTYSHWFPSAEDQTRRAAADIMTQVLATDQHQDRGEGR